MREHVERLFARAPFGAGASAASWFALVFTAVGFGLLSVAVRQDTNWDLRNYHFYGPWALLNGRLDIDLAPAQLQTYLNPLLDVPFYGMVAAHWPARLVAFIMGLPAGIATFALAKILLHAFSDSPPAKRWVFAACGVLGGITATMPVALLGTTMNEWQVTMLMLMALWIIVTHRPVDGSAAWAYWLGGILAGVAAGLKLTSAPYVIGIAAAILFFGVPLRNRLVASLRFCVGAAIGGAASMGAWAWTMYERFGNPLYPFFNQVFRSPWWDAAPLGGHVFGPRTAFEWLTFPLRLAFTTEMYVTEMPIRDARFAILFVVMGLAAIACWQRKRSGARDPESAGNHDTWHVLLCWFVVSFVAWAVTYSILRYALMLQLLATGLTIHLLRWSMPARWMPLAASAVVAVSIATARYVHWGHRDFRGHYLEVEAPEMAPGAAVLLLNGEPMAYVLPFLRADARFVGIDNNLVNPWRRNRMQDAVTSVVERHPGPLYSLTWPAGSGQQALDAYGLRRLSAQCTDIRTNMPMSPLELCPIERRSR